MQYLTAPRIHNGTCWLPGGTTIEVDESGRVVALHSAPVPGTKYYEGTLAPGFVNVHCHLELSHMKGVAKEGTGLIPFLGQVPMHRNSFTEEQKRNARFEAFEELLRNGVVAVGDIANTTDTTDLRSLGKMHFQTFVEALGFTETYAERSFNYALQAYDSFAGQLPDHKRLRQSIVPHAPYSVSSTLFGLIDGHQPGTVICIHNQESEEENKFYMAKEGMVRELFHLMGIDDSHFVPTGKSSLESYLQWLSPDRPYILVHNTYTNSFDISCAVSHAGVAHWCLCPNANLYIENRLPDIDTFVQEGVNICIGTDSLASNHKLCVLSELVTIKEHYPHISWETLLSWGTLNGARALQMSDQLGSIEPGKEPGIISIQGIDEGNGRLSVERVV